MTNKIIAAVLHDVWLQHGVVFNLSAYKNTLQKVFKRVDREGISFLTKTLPRLGKAFDKALTGIPLTAAKHGFKPMPGSELPIFLGEFFSRILAPDGTILPNPCINSVKVVRQVLYLFYKYKLPYSAEQELSVLETFKQTDQGLQSVNERALALYNDTVDDKGRSSQAQKWARKRSTLHRARILLARLFARFDPKDIYPRNGPGAVAGRQKPWDKFSFNNVSANITNTYPRDAYFFASLSHVCDEYKNFGSWTEEDLPARVILVQKDSRGPRLISAEPLDFQWIQQGLSGAIVRLVERHPLTKWNVFFTDQTPNQRGALLGSLTGRYATLDLNEASDRVSVGLVRLLFPSNVFECLMACRSSATELPNGEVIRLQKFAPMGSSLCFPVMALTIWAILTASAPNADARKSILVYGDDVIVPTTQVADAIEQLESCGLKINRDKSCTSGLFRESCGTDAFQGVNVTPVRLRTVWSESRSPEVFTSFIAYANGFYEYGYRTVYETIAGELRRIYGAIPAVEQPISGCPRLSLSPLAEQRPNAVRWNSRLQKRETRVLCVKAVPIRRNLPGWNELLRLFSESAHSRPVRHDAENWIQKHLLILDNYIECETPEKESDGEFSRDGVVDPEHRCSKRICYICGRVDTHHLSAPSRSKVGLYTQRHTSKLVYLWR